MSAIAEPLSFHRHSTSSTTTSGRERRSLIGSLKHTLSRNKHDSGDLTKQSSHRQANGFAAPTRRPVAPSSNPFHNPASFDAPPAYTAAPNSAPQPASSSGNATQVADDAYAFLDTFDTIFVIDDSGSMAGGLWRQTADALMTIAPICTTHDADGIDIHFLNRKDPDGNYKNVTSAAAVQEIFNSVRPGGATPTGAKLHGIFRDYLKKYVQAPETTKPINIICITDGVPTDDVEGALIQTAKKLDKLDAPAWQIGVQFFQVGNDPEATKHLKKLDDELAEISGMDDLRDFIDTVPFTNANGARLSGDGILKVVLGAVTRRLDRKSKELHR